MDSAVAVERTSRSRSRSSLCIDARTTHMIQGFDEEEEQVPSATQTEKSSFVWIPLIEDDDHPTTSSPPPLKSVEKPTVSCLWRDPYLLALDAAVGRRSFSEAQILPPLKPVKTERRNTDRSKLQHGFPKPPSSHRYPMRSALKPPAPRVVALTSPTGEIDVPELDACQEEQEEPAAAGANATEEAQVSSKFVPAAEVFSAVQKLHPELLGSQSSLPCKPVAHAEPSPKRRALSFAHGRRFTPESASRIHRFFKRFQRREEQLSPNMPRTASAPAGATYDLFRTRSRKVSRSLVERQFPNTMCSKRRADSVIDEEKDCGCEEDSSGTVIDCRLPPCVSAGRYFDALQGPELEIPKDSEKLLLPPDERWPFLLRFPVSCFGITLGLGSQSMLWKNLATSPDLGFLHIPSSINLCLWCLSVFSFMVIFFVYILKSIQFFEAVRREFQHPVLVNFFFTPWIAGMFLALGVPPRFAKSIHPAVWCVLMAPVVSLELKIYGQWLSGGDRRLSKVANPSTHLSVVGNFVGSILASTVGWKEPAIFFWAVGLAHYLVLFVTLYQRLPTNETLPKDLHPVFFLFVAAPSAASVAWMSIVGDFDYVSRLVFFVALFLCSSLFVRINFFKGFKFSIAWWAYTFPMTVASIAAVLYCHEANGWITKGLAVGLTFISSATVFAVFFLTLLHAFMWQSLFPNDLAIAITAERPKFKRKGSPTCDNDGCVLYLDHHSQPLFKTVIDEYHQFTSAKEEQNANNCSASGLPDQPLEA
ncbi:hypothetical protein BDL97_01G105700 [Sphagnum fallax]|uniref:Slow anion channel-associated 1a n=1 Tax=Sphagnum fallax TaxID=53036 RepID=A0A977J5F6_9BRYO|nr:hypothetical protein BDL97_01G105700 [Sphagnum fallax]KAH8974510.1 hypothetical protein BDL97_01G105700 [Sphagnum fallax]KAH8974511.1 hypothetical protein BDL97_01G105700 [Sphagnum fallax]UWV48925.1 slow anion channel-associated 1a [Sphagnum fallax]